MDSILGQFSYPDELGHIYKSTCCFKKYCRQVVSFVVQISKGRAFDKQKDVLFLTGNVNKSGRKSIYF